MKYEIEVVDFGPHAWFESEIAMLTGLEFSDILSNPHHKTVDRANIYQSIPATGV